MASMNTEFPQEIWIHILSFLEPTDILSSRSVSKAVHEASTDRVLWMNILEKLCYERDVFRPTYSLSDMPLNVLENLSMAPEIFLRELLQRPSSKHYSRRLVYTHKVQTPDHDPHTILGVPGGRFIVTFWDASMKLWEAADTHGRAQPLRQVDEIRMEDSSFIIEDVDTHVAEPGDTLIIRVCTQRDNLNGPASNNMFGMKLYSLNLSHYQAQLTQVFSFTSSFKARDASSEWILLWDRLLNVNANTYLLIHLSGRLVSRFKFKDGKKEILSRWECLVKRDTLIFHEFLSSETRITIYPMPKAHTVCGPTDDIPTEALEPLFSSSVPPTFMVFGQNETKWTTGMTAISLNQHHFKDLLTLVSESINGMVKLDYYAIDVRGKKLEYQGESFVKIPNLNTFFLGPVCPNGRLSYLYGIDGTRESLWAHTDIFSRDRLSHSITVPEQSHSYQLMPQLETGAEIVDYIVTSFTGRITLVVELGHEVEIRVYELYHNGRPTE